MACQQVMNKIQFVLMTNIEKRVLNNFWIFYRLIGRDLGICAIIPRSWNSFFHDSNTDSIQASKKNLPHQILFCFVLLRTS